MTSQDSKLQQLVLHLSELSKADRTWDNHKLKKQIFFCDFLSYRESGHPITQTQYLAKAAGPMPKAFPASVAQMIADEDIYQENLGLQHRIFPLKTADPSAFSEAQLGIIDQVVNSLWDPTINEVQGLHHHSDAWREAIVQAQSTGATALISYESTLTPQAASEDSPQPISTNILQERKPPQIVPTSTRDRLRDLIPRAIVHGLTDVAPPLTPNAYHQHVYLLQTLYQVPLGYWFTMFTTGMECKESARDLDMAKQRDELKTRYMHDDQSTRILLSDALPNRTSHRELRNLYDRGLNKLTRDFGKKTPRELSLTTSTISIWKGQNPQNEDGAAHVVNLIKTLKPRATQQEIRETIHELRMMEFIKYDPSKSTQSE